MRTLLVILKKEFLQIFRNKIMIPIIFIIPFVQTLVLVYAATLELKNTNIVIVDLDNSQISQVLSSKFKASPFFSVEFYNSNYEMLEDLLLNEQTKAVLIIPDNFENDLKSGAKTSIQLNLNAVDGQSAGLINIYVGQTILSQLSSIRPFVNKAQLMVAPAKIKIDSRFWYNPTLNFKYYMLPGILTILVSMIGIFLTALNIVREKEIGTIEQINVTPIKKWQFIAGKLIPFWIIGIVDLMIGISIGILLFDMPFVGSPWTLVVYTGLYLVTSIALGLLVADFANTTQQAMFSIFFFFLTFVLMCGMFTSVESMPYWAQTINKINPMYYYITTIRSIMLKGSTIKNMLFELFALLAYSIIALSVAVWQYKKTN